MIRRLLSLVVLLAIAASAVVLLLSDRAISEYDRAVDRGMSWAGDVQDRLGLEDVVGRGDIPVGATSAGHIVLCASATLVAGVVLRRRARPWLVATVVFAAAAAFEALQPLLSSSREQEAADLAANGIGALAGFVALTLVLRITRLRRSRSLAW